MVRMSERLDSRFFVAFAMGHETLCNGLARASKLNDTQYRILMMVYQARPEATPQSSIAPLLKLKPNVVTHSVGVLESLKYISRKADACDARAKNLFITGQGKRHIDAVNNALVEELYASWPTDDPAFRRILEATVVSGGQIATDLPQVNPDYFPASHVLTITERSTRLIEADILQQLGISLAEARMLQRLAEVGEAMRMSQLATQLHMSAAMATRIAQSLVGRKWTERLASPLDGKAVFLALTESGQKMACRVQEVIDRSGSKHFWGPMDRDQRKAFRLMGEVVIEDLRRRREDKRKQELDHLVPAR